MRADQLLVAPDHPVDVRAEMRVRVEDLEVRREIARAPLVPLGGDLPCPLERFHSSNLPRGSADSVSTPQRTLSARRGEPVGNGAVHFSRIGGSMKRIYLLVLLSALALPLGAASARGSGSGSLVVGELYAAGGNSGAVYTNDYVELFNRGASAVAVDGWTLQYASASGTSWQSTALGGSIPAGGHYLVQLASGGANGAALPTADATGTSNLAVTGGKVALVDDATALSCGDSAGAAPPPPTCRTSSATAAPPTTREAVRRRRRARPTRWRARTVAARTRTTTRPTSRPRHRIPQNSAAAATTCSVTPPANGASGSAGVDVDIQPVLSLALDHPTLSFPAAVPGTTPDPAPGARHGDEQRSERLHAQRPPHGLHAARPAARHRRGKREPGRGADRARRRTCSLATASGPSADGGDVVATSVGFVSPLPVVPAGHYTATLTFTVIGK